MKIAILIYNGITVLDAIGPYEVLSNIDNAEVFFVAKRKGEIKSDTGFLTLKAKYNFKNIKEADILLIPGSTISFINVMKDNKTLEWIKQIDKTTQFTTSVCSGSIILAKTDLLNGKKATSHWKAITLLEEYNVIPTQERVVRDGKYITSAGVSAGIDMALILCEELIGEDQTKAIQLMIEYDPNPIYQSGNIKTCEQEIINIATKKLKQNARREMSLLKLIRNRKVLKKIK